MDPASAPTRTRELLVRYFALLVAASVLGMGVIIYNAGARGYAAFTVVMGLASAWLTLRSWPKRGAVAAAAPGKPAAIDLNLESAHAVYTLWLGLTCLLQGDKLGLTSLRQGVGYQIAVGIPFAALGIYFFMVVRELRRRRQVRDAQAAPAQS